MRAARRLSTYEFQQRAREHASRALAGMLADAAHAVAAFLARAWQRRRQRAQARAMYHALSTLDDRTLHDLGFERSEITSVASEATGEAQRTRAQTMRALHGLA
jgi:uncharacterized protein YjiS (DUF1127 family)